MAKRAPEARSRPDNTEPKYPYMTFRTGEPWSRPSRSNAFMLVSACTAMWS